MSTTCKVCDKGEHKKCDGTAVYMEQDGPNTYICQCYCRTEIIMAIEKKIQVDEIKRAMKQRGITFEDLAREFGEPTP